MFKFALACWSESKGGSHPLEGSDVELNVTIKHLYSYYFQSDREHEIIEVEKEKCAYFKSCRYVCVYNK